MQSKYLFPFFVFGGGCGTFCGYLCCCCWLFVVQEVAVVVVVVDGWVPPKGDAEWEHVHAMRERLGLQYNYTPQLIHPELCRFLSEEECQDADVGLMEHSQRHRSILQQQQQQHTTTTNNNNSNSGQIPFLDDLQDDQAYLRLLQNTTLAKEYVQQQQQQQQQQHHAQRQLQNPVQGDFRVLVLLMYFTDHADRELPPLHEMQILWNLRIAKWLDVNSFGQYRAYYDVQPWRMTNETETYYSGNHGGLSQGFQKSFWPLLDELDDDPTWDWSPYDLDGDGRLDNLIVLHSGYAAEERDWDCIDGKNWTQRIWSHAFGNVKKKNRWKSKRTDMAIPIETAGYMTSTAIDGICGSSPAKMATMTHEIMHTFGLVDLYDFGFIGYGLGSHDLMAYPYGTFGALDFPSHMSAWSKIDASWLTPTLVETTQTITMKASEESNQAWKIPIRQTEPEEYFLLENRQNKWFDIYYFAPGLTIYHVDNAANGQFNRGYPGQDGWPTNGFHYKLALLQKDGKYDLEVGNNKGDAGDIYQPGDSLLPHDGTNYPNSDSYQGGDIRQTGISITVLSQDESDIVVEIFFDQAMAGQTPPKGRIQPVVVLDDQNHNDNNDNNNNSSGMDEADEWVQNFHQTPVPFLTDEIADFYSNTTTTTTTSGNNINDVNTIPPGMDVPPPRTDQDDERGDEITTDPPTATTTTTTTISPNENLLPSSSALSIYSTNKFWTVTVTAVLGTGLCYHFMSG